MAIAGNALVDLLLLLAGAALIFTVIAPALTSFWAPGYRCELSVTFASLGFTDNALNCQIKEVDMSERVADREEAARFLAEEMLECRRIFGTRRTQPLRSPEWVNTATAPVALLSGRMPEGYLFESDLNTWDKIRWWRHSDKTRKQLCSICSIVTFPDDAYLQGFRDELGADGYGSKTFDDILYGRDTPRHTYYFVKNSDAFMPHEYTIRGEDGSSQTLRDPATAVIFYTERSEKGNSMLGIVAMNQTDFLDMILEEEFDKNLCQVYLS